VARSHGALIRGAVLVPLLMAALLVAATPARAHAVLESTAPDDGAVLMTSPSRIVLRFNEPVAPAGAGVRLFDATGAVVDVGSPEAAPASQVRVPIGRQLAPGSYIATWRVVSADGHPVRGALVFSVGDPAQVDADVMRQVFGSGDRWWVTFGVVLARCMLYAGVLVAVGGLVFLRRVADIRDRMALVPPVLTAAVSGAAAAVLAVPVQAAQVSGAGTSALIDGPALAGVLRSSVGLQSALATVALALLAVTLRAADDPLARAVASAAAALAAAALLVTGHTRTTEPTWLIMLADGVHVAAAAVWLGGLVLLWPSVRLHRGRDDPVGAAGVVSRFSWLATRAVVAVTGAGAALAWMLVRTGDALLTTPYGRTLLVKVAAATVVVALGAYNNRRLLPDIRMVAETTAVVGHAAGPATEGAGVTVTQLMVPPAGREARAWSTLARTVRWELGVLAVVLAVTAVLVGVIPAAEAAGVRGAFSTVVAMGDDAELNLVVDPNRAGRNELHLYLLDDDGRPVPADELQLRLLLPGRDIGPIVRTASPISPGHWVHVGRELAVPGRWRIVARATISRFERPTSSVDVTVRP